MTQTHLRWFASVVLAGLAVFLVYYAWRAFGQLVPFSFGDPSLWENHWMVRGDVTIPMGLRLAYFLVWAVSILATCAMLIVAMYLVNQFRKGEYFDVSMITALQRVGISAVIAGLAIMVASSLWPWMITLYNTEEKRGIALAYDPAEAGIVLVGAGVFMLGWVLRTAVLMRQENEEMI